MHLIDIRKRVVDQLSEISEGWNKFWFEPTDPLILGVMRLLVGSMLVYTHLVWGIDFESFVGDDGWNGEQLVREYQNGTFSPSFWWYVEPDWYGTVHWISVGVLVLFTVGLATRVTSILSMIVVVSYSYKAVLSNYGLDQINSILTFYLCVGPSGAALSLDRLIANRWKTGRWFKSTERTPSWSTCMALRLVQIHFCVIYTYAGLSKLQGNAWWNGEAVWMAFANAEYQTIDMTWIAWYPWLSDVMTHTTIIWEVTFWALVWTRLRPGVLAIGAVLHIGIGAAMGMWTFALIMIYGHIAFWAPEMAIFVVRLVQQPGLWLAGLLGSRSKPTKATAVEQVVESDIDVAPVRLADDDTVSAPTPVDRRHILVVGKSAKFLNSVQAYFEERDFACSVTQDTDDAIEIAQTNELASVVVIGRGMNDETLHELYHGSAISEARQLLLVVSQDQASRNPLLTADHNVRLFVGATRLGQIRKAVNRRPKPVPVKVGVGGSPETGVTASKIKRRTTGGSKPR